MGKCSDERWKEIFGKIRKTTEEDEKDIRDFFAGDESKQPKIDKMFEESGLLS